MDEIKSHPTPPPPHTMSQLKIHQVTSKMGCGWQLMWRMKFSFKCIFVCVCGINSSERLMGDPGVEATD